MIVDLAHKIRLNVTPEQDEYFQKAARASRQAWNWGLSEYNRHKEDNLPVKITGKGDTLKARFSAIKGERYPYIADVSTYGWQQSFIDLQAAVSRYFDLLKKGKLVPPKGWKPRKDGKPFGWPRFKSRYHSKPAFYEANLGLRFDGYNVRLPRIGWVNMTEQVRFDGRVMSARISYENGYWWISVQVRMEREEATPKGGAIGVDLGVKYLAVTHDGQESKEYDNPRPTYEYERKLRRLQRQLDRQLRAGNPGNYNEDGTAKPKEECERFVYSNKALRTKERLDRLHLHIRNIRLDAAHKLTSEIAQDYEVIVVEDLNIKGMMQNKKLSKAISDAGMYEKRRQLTYKSELHGGVTIPVSQWYPSSKTCSACGWVNPELKLKDREWVCQECGVIHHRDENAALNLRQEGLRILQD